MNLVQAIKALDKEYDFVWKTMGASWWIKTKGQPIWWPDVWRLRLMEVRRSKLMRKWWQNAFGIEKRVRSNGKQVEELAKLITDKYGNWARWDGYARAVARKHWYPIPKKDWWKYFKSYPRAACGEFWDPSWEPLREIRAGRDTARHLAKMWRV